MILNFAQTSLGAPLERLTRDDLEQDASYWTGNGLGWLPEDAIAEILRNASVAPHLTGSATSGFKERFERLDYQVAGALLPHGVQGRFELELTSPGPIHEIFANVPWRLNVEAGVTATESQIFSATNAALQDYWVTFPPGRVALRSRADALTIPITPRVVPAAAGDPFAWTIHVHPDSLGTLPFPNEVVWMADFSWRMRETFSFRPREHEPAKAGRGPHEVGHMMGIPHDIGDRFTIMSTIEDAGFNHWRYSLGGDPRPVLRPYAAHFKLFKVWAEIVFAQMGRLEDFVIQMPQTTP